MTTLYVSCTPTAVDADGICKSQSPGSGAILINGDLASAKLTRPNTLTV